MAEEKDSTTFPGTSRFEPIRKLGEGGMGAVFLVRDQELNSDVALKLLPRVNPSALYRFKREFRSLTEIIHPNLVALYELVANDEQWFFTMEHVAGTRFNEWISRFTSTKVERLNIDEPTIDLSDSGEPVETGSSSNSAKAALKNVVCDWDKLHSAFSQLVTGIKVLHRAGKIHRDIKHSNVLVRENGQVVILDFGLIAELQSGNQEHPEASSKSGTSWTSDSHSMSNQIVGTLRYMSPEQAAGNPVTPASDWYSVGVMLYEVLVGRSPFSGNLLKVLSQKQNKKAPPIATRVTGVPENLARLCDQLLAIDPDQRPTYERIIDVFGESVVLQPATVHQSQTFVGRGRQLKELRSGFSSMVSGERVAVSISGQSGFGKSTLVEHFLDELRSQDVVILSGRCYEQESVPFKTLDSLIDSLCRYLNSLSEAAAARFMPRHVGELARLFPVLNQIEFIETSASSQADRLRDRHVRQLAFLAFAEMIARIGDQHPLVLFIDDVQWGDSDSVEAIRELLESKSPVRVMFVASHRSEYGLPEDYSEMLTSLASDNRVEHHEILIGPLDDADAREIVTGCIGDQRLAESTVDKIIQDAHGSPLFLQELVQHFLDNSSPTLDQDPAAAQNSATGQELGLDEVIQNRVATLESNEREFLEMLAISGKPTPLNDLLSSLPPIDDPLHIIARLRSARLLSGTAVHASDMVQVYHDRVRESVSTALPDDRKTSCHLKWTETLLKQADPDPESLAIHYHGGGDAVTAGSWYARAAEVSSASLAFEHAAFLYEQSLELRPTTGDEELNLRNGLALAYANAGRGNQSAEQYLRVAELSDPSRRLDLKAQAASQLCISGHIDKGLATFAEVLNTYKVKLPTGRTGILCDLLWQRSRLWLRGLKFQRRDEKDIAPATLKRIDNLWAIASGLSTANNLSSAALQSRLLRECLDCGDVYRISRSLSWEAFLTSAGGQFERAGQLLLHANSLADESGNRHAKGMCMLVKGLVEFQQAKFLRAVELLNLAEKHFREQSIGGWWELATIRWLRGTSLLHAGELNELNLAAPEDYKDARERGDLFALTNMQAFLLPFLELSKGGFSKAIELVGTSREAWNHSGFHYQHLQSVFMDCMIKLTSRQGEDALKVVESYWPAMKKALVLHNKLVRVMMLDTRATCTLAAAETSPDSDRLLRTAEKYSQSLRKEGDTWSQSFADRISGGVARHRGQTADAIEHWKRAITGFEHYDMKLHAASVEIALAQILPDDDGRQMRAHAEETVRAEGVTAIDSFCACLTWTPAKL